MFLVCFVHSSSCCSNNHIPPTQRVILRDAFVTSWNIIIRHARLIARTSMKAAIHGAFNIGQSKNIFKR